MADINLMCQRIYCLCEMGMLPFEPLPSSVARSPVDISLAAAIVISSEFLLRDIKIRTGLLSVSGELYAQSKGEVNVYSYRQPDLIKPILDEFTAKTGIKVNFLYADKGLEERIRIEGDNSPADVLLSTDVYALENLENVGLSDEVTDKKLLARVPENMRDPDGHWLALTKRARVLYISKERVKKSDINSYLDLAAPRFKGKICMRPGSHLYNLGLFSAMNAHYGKAKTEEWLKGLRANLARKPAGNDRAQAKAVMEGLCDIALGNSYYYGLMTYNEKEPEQKKWAAAVEPVFPSGEFGTHMNISGFALVRTAPNKANALKLLEFLLSDKAQQDYADLNYEFPAVPGVKYGKKVSVLFPQKFKEDILNPIDVARGVPDALKTVNRLEFDN
ncbi:hypothetical protein CHS0354_006924 [Potamilus streckersoni]|uniref:Iron ABC transporter substrate-binding protein n=1 Tax=Potamilus streckersoni TaxID=2493646 RepID=A0AAE0TFD0_9BIVA|nr:hypothetical protein CHS0354_006924 [Potamilus streckersoni]